FILTFRRTQVLPDSLEVPLLSERSTICISSKSPSGIGIRRTSSLASTVWLRKASALKAIILSPGLCPFQFKLNCLIGVNWLAPFSSQARLTFSQRYTGLHPVLHISFHRGVF